MSKSIVVETEITGKGTIRDQISSWLDSIDEFSGETVGVPDSLIDQVRSDSRFFVYYALWAVFELPGFRKSPLMLRFNMWLSHYLYPSEDREAILGDIFEKYEKDCKRFGEMRAGGICAGDTAKSTFALIFQLIREFIFHI
jgi:hypothetical protein